MAAPVFDIAQLIAWIMVCHCEWCFQKSRDHEDPQFHAISERGFAIQSYLRIPPQIGFFSSALRRFLDGLYIPDSGRFYYFGSFGSARTLKSPSK
ncbi:hypothetical protein CPLU01_10844 [Colletotrichum plurivorum]|uniref:Uncharacterized protein n=1 Tax=Colletotrichum plurivorum TaxID=2175906 RepID=A0A8H6K3R6_9PEZI|nr:hypothetical protein CPLU01_10844 [Colletotrichum plurivorum]